MTWMPILRASAPPSGKWRSLNNRKATAMAIVTVPESVRCFFTDRADHEALRLLADGGLPPVAVPWEELRTFNAAVASAQTLKFDLVEFLYDAWAATWGAALSDAFPDAYQEPLTEYSRVPMADPSPEAVWAERTINNLARVCEDAWLWSAVWISGEFPGALKLAFLVQDGEGNQSLSDNLALDEVWTGVDDGFRNTVVAVPLTGDAEVDLKALEVAAAGALQWLVAALPRKPAGRVLTAP
jgi:hypothetical protein